jgi:DnaK suppressor protein
MKTTAKRRPAPAAGKGKGRSGKATTTRRKPRGADRWSWHRADLLALRERLEAEARELRAASAGPLTADVGDSADAAEGRSGRDLIIAELRTEEGLLEEVEAALARLAAGTYGICEATGRPIPPSRLRAIPWTRFGRAAASAARG